MTARLRSPVPPPPSSKRGKTGSAGSGQHPVVQAYRAKLDSIEESAVTATSDLDRRLEEFLTELKTPAPPRA